MLYNFRKALYILRKHRPFHSVNDLSSFASANGVSDNFSEEGLFTLLSFVEKEDEIRSLLRHIFTISIQMQALVCASGIQFQNCVVIGPKMMTNGQCW